MLPPLAICGYRSLQLAGSVPAGEHWGFYWEGFLPAGLLVCVDREGRGRTTCS